MYKLLKNEIVTVVTHMGEMIGRLSHIDDKSLTLKDARLFISQEGGGGFAPGVCMTGEMHPKEVTYNMNNVVYVIKTHDDVTKGWLEATSGLILQ